MTALDREVVKQRLTRLLSGGKLKALPKREPDRHLLFALAAARLRTQCIESENDVNVCLAGWLSGFSRPVDLDHVSLRRALVDHHYLHRRHDASSYRVNADLILTVLDPNAYDVDPGEIYEQGELDREERRQRYVGQSESKR